MKKGMKLVLIFFVISLLASCASDGVILPNMVPSAEKTFEVNEQGTVEILGQDMITEPTHWLYVECDHWSGCYMRCQGKINSCKKVATDSGLEVDYIYSRAGSEK